MWASLSTMKCNVDLYFTSFHHFYGTEDISIEIDGSVSTADITVVLTDRAVE